MDFDTDEYEDISLFEIQGAGEPMHAGITNGGEVFLRGDIHPLGAFAALITAAKNHVPYVAVNAVNVIFPANWLRAECLHDQDRLRVIDNMEKMIRGAV
jgi:hypothetical protein